MDLRQTRTTAQQTNTAAGHAIEILRFCYRSFLLHFILGICTAFLLLFSVIALSNVLPSVPTFLNTAAQIGSAPTCRVPLSSALPQAVFSYAAYLPPEDTARYFDTSTNSTVLSPHHRTLRTDACLYIKDSIADPIEKPLITDPHTADALYQTDAVTPQGHTAIRAVDLSASSQYNDTNGGILFSNQTDYTLTAAPYLAADYPIPAMTLPVLSVHDRTAGAEKPLVLILHTHGTEAYAPDGAASVPSGYAYRSEDITENVVSVGAVLAETLQAAGIPVLHCTTMFDADSYTDSYVKAAAYIRQTVSDYPSIAYVFDVHRDALEDTDGNMLRPVTQIGSEICAQVMSVVGTDNAGAYHPDWENNLTVAVHLQKRLNDAYRTFTRPINLRAATFNAQYAPGSLLLEIGAAGNSVTEARSAAYHLGLVLADLILTP